eukprot:TRINITY_DN8991_c2_g2_i2.p1 TRINITY_DN8991_c2_g2~~TRINITY_DN8991_c2_g2_i2.p1  ORF type:complete len:328 (+),score=38.64 TRINITY_DN8991_c2_g2_i2:84-986(+)
MDNDHSFHPSGWMEGPGGKRMKQEIMKEEHEMMRDFFPGPLTYDHKSRQSAPHAFAEPDPLVLDMVSHIDHAVKDTVIPAIQKVDPNGATALSCMEDIAKFCPASRSQSQCLGKYSDSVSAGCLKAVGKSVPFLCSRSIEKFCAGQVGILPCLRMHMVELPKACKGAVHQTHKAIKKVNQRAANTKPTMLPYQNKPSALPPPAIKPVLPPAAPTLGPVLPHADFLMPTQSPAQQHHPMSWTFACFILAIWGLLAYIFFAYTEYGFKIRELILIQLNLSGSKGERQPLILEMLRPQGDNGS